VDDLNEKTLPFINNTKYKVGAVTYDVTAHFCDERETLKSKICTLLTEEIRRSNSIYTVECGHGDVV